MVNVQPLQSPQFFVITKNKNRPVYLARKGESWEWIDDAKKSKKFSKQSEGDQSLQILKGLYPDILEGDDIELIQYSAPYSYNMHKIGA